jgi:peptide/nickel transport system ATP-binding protein
MTSLNPVLTVGTQIAETVRAHESASRAEARQRAIEMLRTVGIADPERRVDSYPHELSGGMRQRVLIAIALVCRPRVLIADEPTTALDVTIQAQILDLLSDLKQRLGMAMILITHNLGLAAGIADRVAVMYGGRLVELAPTAQLFANPAHPYTAGLLRAAPRLDGPNRPTPAIPGAVPAATAWPEGCRFHPRCTQAWERCQDEPPLLEVGKAHHARCWLVDGASR